jgi:3-hydroxyisobutyrate dehydrogenase-like beta-hydroxyacid dehydrogenase
MTQASASVYKKVMDQGLGDNDFSAVAEAYRKNK